MAFVAVLNCSFQETELATGVNDGESTGDQVETDTDASGDDSGAVDTGVSLPEPLVRYRVNNTSLGQVPFLIDDAPNPVNLPMVYNSSTSPILMQDQGGDIFLDYSDQSESENGGGRLPITNTKLEVVDGASQVTLVAKYSLESCDDGNHRLAGFSNGSVAETAGWLLIREDAGFEFLAIRFKDQTETFEYIWPTPCPLALRNAPAVVHWVIDTTQENPEDRVKGYIDGERQILALSNSVLAEVWQESDWPTKDAEIDLQGEQTLGSVFVLGTDAFGGRKSNASIWYVSLFSEALTEEQIVYESDLLKESDDK